MIHKVGERISSYRKNRNMSQEELPTLLNVSRQTISKWETGDTLPDVYNVVALSKMFHISLDVLILGAHSKLGGPSYVTDIREKRQKKSLGNYYWFNWTHNFCDLNNSIKSFRGFKEQCWNCNDNGHASLNDMLGLCNLGVYKNKSTEC